MNRDEGKDSHKPDSEPQPERRSALQRIEGHMWRRLGAGLLAIIPLLITVLILRFVFNMIDHIFRGDGGLLERWIAGTVFDFPGVGVIVTIVLLYVVGALYASRAGRALLNVQRAVLTRIPVARRIYNVAQQATDSLSASQHQFSRVVFFEWPRPGVLAMGFVTARCISPQDPEVELLAIYIPTIPNPTSGMLAFAREDEVVESDMTVEDAMKVVFSGAIVLPDGLQPPEAVQPQDGNDR